MLTFIICIAALVALVGAGGTAHAINQRSNPDAIEAKKVKELSWAGRQVMEAWERIPEEHRPDNPHHALEVLDEKYRGKEEVDKHFSYRYSYSAHPTKSWSDCRCQFVTKYGHLNRSFGGEGCEMSEYKALFESFRKIVSEVSEQEAALEERAHQMKVAGMETDLQDIDRILQQAKDNARIVREVTQEIKESQ